MLSMASTGEGIREVMSTMHKRKPFRIDATVFHSFCFLDDENTELSQRLSLDLKTDVLTIASHSVENPTETVHAEMRCRPMELRLEHTIPLDVEGAIARATNVTYKDEFYATIGNNYQGEFQTVEQAWTRRGFDSVHGRPQLEALPCCYAYVGGSAGEPNAVLKPRPTDGPEVVARIEFGHTNTDPFLRGGAWLDATNQPGALMSQLDVDAKACWPKDMLGRPYFAAAIKSYEVLDTDFKQTATMWGHHFAPTEIDGQPVDSLANIYNGDRKLVVQIHNGEMGTLVPGFLDDATPRTWTRSSHVRLHVNQLVHNARATRLLILYELVQEPFQKNDRWHSERIVSTRAQHVPNQGGHNRGMETVPHKRASDGALLERISPPDLASTFVSAP